MGERRHARLQDNGGEPVLLEETVVRALLMGAAPGGSNAAGCCRKLQSHGGRGESVGYTVAQADRCEPF